jgi:hypothetical protein
VPGAIPALFAFMTLDEKKERLRQMFAGHYERYRREAATQTTEELVESLARIEWASSPWGRTTVASAQFDEDFTLHDTDYPAPVEFKVGLEYADNAPSARRAIQDALAERLGRESVHLTEDYDS